MFCYLWIITRVVHKINLMTCFCASSDAVLHPADSGPHGLQRLDLWNVPL